MNQRCIIVVLGILGAATTGFGVGAEEPEAPKLLGRCTVGQLEQEPFSEWFRSGYENYVPNAEVLEGLRTVETRGVRVSVFFGTWCEDSRREVPRWLKLFEVMAFTRDRVELVAVDNADEAVKRSPGGEERGLEIYRVPTMIVRRGDIEAARIVEHPVHSIERDLLAILEQRPYEPSYAAYPAVRRWLAEGLLGDPNVGARGLANEVRQLVSGEGELGAAALVMLSRGDTAEAVKLSQVNCAIHRLSPTCHQRLAEAWLEAGDGEKVRKAAERALSLNDDPDRIAPLLELIKKGTDLFNHSPGAAK